MMRKFIDIINESQTSVVVHLPQSFSEHTTHTWLSKMANQYGIGYRTLAPHVCEIRGEPQIVSKISAAIARLADETATPEHIIDKVFELTAESGLPALDAISHCAKKFGKTEDQIQDMIYASESRSAFGIKAMLNPEVIVKEGLFDSGIREKLLKVGIPDYAISESDFSKPNGVLIPGWFVNYDDIDGNVDHAEMVALVKETNPDVGDKGFWWPQEIDLEDGGIHRII